MNSTAAHQPASHDANTEALLSREQGIRDGWKDRDGRRFDALLPPDVQFIDIFGPRRGYTSRDDQWLVRASMRRQELHLSDSRATRFTPSLGTLTLYATVDGSCFGQPVIQSGPPRSVSGMEIPGYGASASIFPRKPVRSDSDSSAWENVRSHLIVVCSSRIGAVSPDAVSFKCLSARLASKPALAASSAVNCSPTFSHSTLFVCERRPSDLHANGFSDHIQLRKICDGEVGGGFLGMSSLNPRRAKSPARQRIKLTLSMRRGRYTAAESLLEVCQPQVAQS